MQKVITALSGKKTYLLAAVTAAYGIADLVSTQHYAQILPYILASAFGATIRAAIAKVEAKIDAKLPAGEAKVVNAVIEDAETVKVVPPVS